MTTCSNGVQCHDKVVVSTVQVANSIKTNVVNACAFVNKVHGDSDSVTWRTLVHPVVSKVIGESGLAVQYA